MENGKFFLSLSPAPLPRRGVQMQKHLACGFRIYSTFVKIFS